MTPRRSVWSDPRMLLVIPVVILAFIAYSGLTSRRPVTAEQQQQLAAAQLQDNELRDDHPSRTGASDATEMSAVDRVLLDKSIRRVKPDGTPDVELWTPASAALAVGGGVLFLGGLATLLIWRQAYKNGPTRAPSAGS